MHLGVQNGDPSVENLYPLLSRTNSDSATNDSTTYLVGFSNVFHPLEVESMCLGMKWGHGTTCPRKMALDSLDSGQAVEKTREKSGSTTRCFTKDGLGNDEYMVYIYGEITLRHDANCSPSAHMYQDIWDAFFSILGCEPTVFVRDPNDELLEIATSLRIGFCWIYSYSIYSLKINSWLMIYSIVSKHFLFFSYP